MEIFSLLSSKRFYNIWCKLRDKPRNPLKPKLPPEFSGIKKKDQFTGQDWIFLLEQYLSIAAENSSESNIVNFAGTLFVGPAASWWVSFRSNNPELSWSHFKEAFLKEFQDIGEAREARDMLVQIRQGASTVQEYAASYRKIIRKIPTLAAEEQVYFFSLGLRLAIARREIAFRTPKNLDEAIHIAHTFEQLAPESPRFYPKSFPSAQNHAEQKNEDLGSSENVPMEIGSINSRGPLSESEKSELRRNNGCFYGRKPNAGHQSWNCPAKPRNQKNQPFQRGQ